MREIIRTSEFKRQLKLAKKRGKDLQKLVDIVEKLQKDEVSLTIDYEVLVDIVYNFIKFDKNGRPYVDMVNI